MSEKRFPIEAPAEDPLFEAGLRVIRTLDDNGHQAVFAGGCVRDRLMGERPKDYDIATDAGPDTVEELFDRTVPVGKSFGVVIVLMDEFEFDVARFREDEEYMDGRRPSDVSFSTPEEDVKRRDFTVNGLLWDPLEGDVIDYVDGVSDLEAEVIRTIGDPDDRFSEDYLRMLRAPRFAAQLNFDLVEETSAAIRKNAPRITEIAEERILEELKYLFESDHPDRGVRAMWDLGLLRELMPEVTELEQIRPVGADDDHTVMDNVMAAFDDWSNRKRAEQDDGEEGPETSSWVLPSSPDDVDMFGPKVGFSLLLHDVGRPEDDEPGLEVPQADRSSARRDLAEEILGRLRASTDLQETVGWSVFRLRDVLTAGQLSLAEKKRLIADSRWPVVAAVARSVSAVTAAVDEEPVRELFELAHQLPEEAVNPEPLITGEDLKDLGLCPGPIFGELLDEVRTAQLNEEITSREEALDLVRDRVED